MVQLDLKIYRVVQFDLKINRVVCLDLKICRRVQWDLNIYKVHLDCWNRWLFGKKSKLVSEWWWWWEWLRGRTWPYRFAVGNKMLLSCLFLSGYCTTEQYCRTYCRKVQVILNFCTAFFPAFFVRILHCGTILPNILPESSGYTECLYVLQTILIRYLQTFVYKED